MTSQPRVLFVSSSGGHWIQLRRLRPAFEAWNCHFACTDPGCRTTIEPGEKFFAIPEASRWNKLRLVYQAGMVLWTLFRVRPEVVVSTGAAPGFFAMLFGSLLGRKTIWVDSIANVDELSLSGRQARRFADLWLTQWEHLERPEGPKYFGSVV